MPITIVCPHCTFDFTPGKLNPGGFVQCGVCEQTFLPTPEQAAQIAEESLAVEEAAKAAAEAVLVAEVVDPATPRTVRERSRESGGAKSPRDRSPRSDGGGENPWAEFRRGSRDVCIGILTELIALTGLLLIQLPGVVIAATGHGTTPTFDSVREVVTWLCVVALVGGSIAVAVGRTEQANIPADRMPRSSSTLVALVGWLGVLVLIASLLLFESVLQTVKAGRTPPGGTLFSTVSIFLVGAFALRNLADLGSVINLGIVGGVMPNRLLQNRVMSTNIAIQLFVLGYLAVLMFLALYPITIPRGGLPSDPTVAIAFGLVVYVLSVGYWLVLYSLNATARRAAERWETGRGE